MTHLLCVWCLDLPVLSGCGWVRECVGADEVHGLHTAPLGCQDTHCPGVDEGRLEYHQEFANRGHYSDCRPAHSCSSNTGTQIMLIIVIILESNF